MTLNITTIRNFPSYFLFSFPFFGIMYASPLYYCRITNMLWCICCLLNAFCKGSVAGSQDHSLNRLLCHGHYLWWEQCYICPPFAVRRKIKEYIFRNLENSTKSNLFIYDRKLSNFKSHLSGSGPPSPAPLSFFLFFLII